MSSHHHNAKHGLYTHSFTHTHTLVHTHTQHLLAKRCLWVRQKRYQIKGGREEEQRGGEDEREMMREWMRGRGRKKRGRKREGEDERDGGR